MVTFSVITREGQTLSLQGEAGVSVMENIKEGGVDELLALCGGCLSCATCHVFVDESFIDRLPPVAEDEDELLNSSDFRRGNSRLSCQIELTESLAGLSVTIAPE